MNEIINDSIERFTEIIDQCSMVIACYKEDIEFLERLGNDPAKSAKIRVALYDDSSTELLPAGLKFNEYIVNRYGPKSGIEKDDPHYVGGFVGKSQIADGMNIYTRANALAYALAPHIIEVYSEFIAKEEAHIEKTKDDLAAFKKLNIVENS